MTETPANPPEGFEPHFRKSPLTAPWEPLFSKVTDDAVIIGLRAAAQHCNARGSVHGGLISALADNAMGLSCARRRDHVGGLVTITLNMDFLQPAQIGQWLEFRANYVRNGGKIDVAQGQVTADGEPCALVAATFRVLSKR
ncbi:MAG: PaaI family thioesterase [Minwuia sp.]|nr:PaaI family thioesterase [Minwuia sp.]